MRAEMPDERFPAPRPRSHFSYVPGHTQHLLDVGCNHGDTLEYALGRGVPYVYGIDINRSAIELARARLAREPRAVIHHGSADALPFENASMDVVLCSEVMEHVPEALRPKAFKEIARVLRADGRLIMSVPHDGLFAFLDPANIRFRAPIVWRVASRLVGGVSRDAGYEGEKHGVIWHHHFRMPELRALLGSDFDIEHVNYRGTLFMPICDMLAFPFYRRRVPHHPLMQVIRAVAGWDQLLDAGERFAYDVMIVARKR